MRENLKFTIRTDTKTSVWNCELFGADGRRWPRTHLELREFEATGNYRYQQGVVMREWILTGKTVVLRRMSFWQWSGCGHVRREDIRTDASTLLGCSRSRGLGGEGRASAPVSTHRRLHPRVQGFDCSLEGQQRRSFPSGREFD